MARSAARRTGALQALAAWLPALAWMALLYRLSAEPGLRVLPLVMQALRLVGLDLLPDAVSLREAALLEWVARKSGHVTAYAVLAVLLQAAVGRTPALRPLGAWAAGTIGLTYAALDEWHQSWIPGREGRMADVLIDALGLGAGLAVAVWVARRRGPRR